MTGRSLLVETNVVLGAVVEEVLRHSGYEVIFVKTLLGEVERFDSLSAVILDIDTTVPAKELVWLGVLQPDDDFLPIVLMGLQVPEKLCRRLLAHLGPQQTYALTVLQKPFRNEALLAAARQVQESSLPGRATGMYISGSCEQSTIRRKKIRSHEMRTLCWAGGDGSLYWSATSIGGGA